MNERYDCVDDNISEVAAGLIRNKQHDLSNCRGLVMYLLGVKPNLSEVESSEFIMLMEELFEKIPEPIRNSVAVWNDRWFIGAHTALILDNADDPLVFHQQGCRCQYAKERLSQVRNVKPDYYLVLKQYATKN